MSLSTSFRVGYVVKRYPRFSETFIVNEVLAHEAAALSLDIFTLRPSVDTHFQDGISRVRAAVHYLPSGSVKASTFWGAVHEAARLLPGFWSSFEATSGEDVVVVYQAVLLAMEVRRKRISHLHAHFATSAASVARLAARFAGVPYSITAHAKDIYHESVDRDDLRRKLADAATVVTVSDFNVSYLKREFGDAASRVERVYNGLDLDHYRFSSFQQRAPHVVAVGRLIPKKGFDVLIDACASLARRGREFTCSIIGSGDLEHRLLEQIDRLEIGQHVSLLGPLPQREVIERIRGSRILAAPCVVGKDGNRDGLPTVLLEAMALGTPCISTDVTGIPEIVNDGETGLLVPNADPLSLANAMERLFADADLCERLAKQARCLMEKQFDIRHNTARIRNLFEAAARVNGVAQVDCPQGLA